ncbi:MAG: thioesterase [Firmicutes bacterium HGW-Firmicutes-12]|jgi:acyl-coenzyme A thioesterase PaaI-like protein|nr:MAG: thioesterase [Firmicutes bacterium HGW-Firmicutes-12]
MEIDYNHHCFGCGELNSQSLKLKFLQGVDGVYTIFTPGDYHQGYPGIMHGGITSTLLDEVMSNCIVAIGFRAVTARLEVRFRQSIPLYRQLRIEGRITGRKRRVVDTEGYIYLDGEIAAEATARFMIVQDGVLY